MCPALPQQREPATLSGLVPPPVETQGWIPSLIRAGLRWAGLAGLGLWQGEAWPGPPPPSGVLTSLLTTLKLFLTSSSLLLPVLPGTHLLPPSWSGPGPPSPILGVPLGSLPGILLVPRMTLFSWNPPLQRL